MRKLHLLTIGLLLSIFGVLALPNPASALSGSDFKPGRIIDDAIFYNPNGMSSSQIQSFLNSKVPTCNTNHAKSSSPNDSGPPYTCLKSYHQNTPAKSAESGLCKAISAKSNQSAANIIYSVSQACGVNPKVIIVMLQKEQSLITDTWPWDIQYNRAMGYACPDSGPNNSANCNSAYYGFFNQVYSAARQFKRYAQTPTNWGYRALRNNYIQYHPNTACGGGNVYIQNQATAGLYIYTPYQPNAKALSNIYGSQTDGCSSYGNRNFWRLFNEWFGKTTLACQSNEKPYAEVMRAYNPQTYKHFWSGYVCEINTLQASHGYHYEGIAFYQAPASSPYAVVVHRLYNPATQLHLWATTQADINNATQKAGYRYEGVAFYGVKPSVPRHVPVHRLYNPKTYLHLWATTQADINNATQKAGYIYEGVAFYGAPPPQ